MVNRAEFEQSLGTLYSLFQSVESTGVEQTSEVLRCEVVVDPEAAAHLEIEEDAELVLVERLRLAGGSPLAVDRAWLPRASILAADGTAVDNVTLDGVVPSGAASGRPR